MRYYFSAGWRPAKNPFCVGNREIYAPMAYRGSEFFMPVGTVQSVAAVEVHNIGNIRDIVVIALHPGGPVFSKDTECSDHCLIPFSSG